MQTMPEMSVPALVMNCLAPSIDPFAAVEPRPGVDVAGVGARLRLGQAERAELPPARRLRQPLALLLLAAEQVDRLGAQRGVGAERDRDRGVDAGQLLDGERVGERVAAAAAVLLGERDAHQARASPSLAHDLVGEALLAVQLLGDRRHLLRAKSRDGALDQAVVVGEVEVHGRDLYRMSRSNFEGSFGVAVRLCRRMARAPAPPTRPALRAALRAQAARGRRDRRPAVRPARLPGDLDAAT